LSQVEHDPGLPVGVVGGRRHEGDGGAGRGDVPGERSHLGQLAQVPPVATDNEVPALRVLRAGSASSRSEDAIEVFFRQRPVGERADGSIGPDRLPDLHGSGV
jgi:hypothetical protein